MKPHHKENTIYTLLLVVVLGIIAIFAVNAAKGLDSMQPQTPKVSISTTYPEIISSPLAALNINESDLTACTSDPATSDIIDTDISEAGATGTPLFYIYSDKIAYKIVGAIPAEMFTGLLSAIEQGQDLPIPEDSKDNFQKVTFDDTNTFIKQNETDTPLRVDLKTPTVTIVEYGDLSCPACKYAHSELKKTLTDSPKTQFIFRHHPLTSLHEFAYDQAKVAICLQKIAGPKIYWDFVDLSYRE